jgi:Kef-type K+ transport system membrane component KefB
METYHATTLLLLALGAFVIPLLSERIRIPAAVGEILFGILIAEHGLGLIQRSPFTSFLGHFGFAFLMFLAGMEIDFTKVESLGKKGVALTAFISTAVFLLAFAVVVVFEQPYFFILVLGSMSLGLVLVALRDTGSGQSHMGQIILIVGSIGEFLSIILLTVTDLAVLHGFGTDLVWGLAKLGLVFVIAYVFLVVLRTLVWWYPEQFQRVVRSHDTAEIGVRLSFALMLGFIAASILMGVEMILGAFIAGALMSFVFREKEAVEEKLSSFGFGFFVPIFFIEVGIGFDVVGVLQGEFIFDLFFLLIAGFFVRTAPMLLLPLLGLRWKESLAAGVALSAPLTLLVAISQVGLHAGLVEHDTAGAIVLYAIVGGILFPVLFRRIVGVNHAASG